VSLPDHVIRTAKDERDLERKLNALELADLEELLRQPWGRRLYHRLVFLMGNLYSESFEPAIKDGMCAALHMARAEGVRWMARTLANEAQLHFPELWNQMLAERVLAAAEEARLRQQARTASTEGDDR
jgi:hypothetical protein